MSYTRVNWQDAPSVSTPLSASNLNKMDAGIKQNADDIEALQQHTYDSALNDTSTNAPQTKVVKKAIEDAVESVTIITDPTLSNEGQAADAKATGEAVTQLKSAILLNDYIEIQGVSFTDNRAVRYTTGNYVTSNGHKVTSYIALPTGAKKIKYTRMKLTSSDSLDGIAFYRENEESYSFVPGSGVSSVLNEAQDGSEYNEVDVPPTATHVRITYFLSETGMLPFYLGVNYLALQPYYTDLQNEISGIKTDSETKYNLLKNGIFNAYWDDVSSIDDYEQGNINTADGEDVSTGSAAFIRSIMFTTDKFTQIIVNQDTRPVRVFRYAPDGSFIRSDIVNQNDLYIIPIGQKYRVRIGESTSGFTDRNEQITVLSKLIKRVSVCEYGFSNTASFVLTFDNVDTFIATNDYSENDYTYTQVTDCLNKQNKRNDVGLPVIIPLPNINNVARYDITIMTDKTKIFGELSGDNIDRFLFCFDSSRKCAEIYTLLPNTRYYYRIGCAFNDGVYMNVGFGCVDTENSQVRMFDIPKTQNVRDIGGWTGTNSKKVKYGVIIRGSALNEEWAGGHVGQHITDEGCERLARYLQVNYDIDLRAADPNNITSPLNVNYVNIPLAMYENVITNKPPIMSDLLQTINTAVSNNKAVYIHCSGGCDRTGTIVTLLLALLGVSESDLSKEYELTSFSVIGAGRIRNSTTYHYKNLIEALKNQTGNSLQEKTENWFLSCGVSASDISTFIANMLE